MISDDDSHLRKLERGLYTGDGTLPQSRHVLHAKKFDAPDDWGTPLENPSFTPMSNKPTTPSSFFKKLFLGSLGILVIALIFFTISFLTGGNTISSKNVELTITAKTFVDGGEDLPVTVTIVNKNKLALELATLTLQYPEGNPQNPNAIGTISHDIGTMAAGETRNESFDIKLYGQQNSIQNLTAHMQFDVAGSNAVYTNDNQFAVTIRTSPVLLTLNAPASVTPNQEIPLAFSIVGNGTATLANTALIVQYPNGFTFTHADPAPSFQQNVWYLGDLPPGTNRTITVYGKFSGAINSSQSVSASVGAQNANNQSVLDTVYNDVAQVIPLAQSFLATQIMINGKSDAQVAVNATSPIQVTIPYQNTLGTTISNAEIHVHLAGSAYDSSSVQPLNGYFNSGANEIDWTSQQVPGLANLAPGASDQLSFSITPKQFGSGSRVSNPVINLSVDILGYTTGGVKQTVLSVNQKTIALNSDISLLSSTLHYAGGISNTGPMPAKSNKETTYTLVWQVTNSRNKVSGVTVTTTLPTNVTWKNNIIPASQSSNVTYNAVTRTLQWVVGDVAAANGSSPAVQNVSMQVGITPSTTQSGAIADLTGPITVTGHDTFTNQDLTITHRQNTTQLLNDTSTVGGDGVVQ